jgi:tetratricopeptide (TPR) repeat protein
MLSFLRWESSSLAAAHDNIMQAERLSRSAEPEERLVALAQAAKCLVLLERNLSQAEAFVMEADSLSHRCAGDQCAVSFAIGMIAYHRGELDEAVKAFEEARELSRQQGEHLTEFSAVEHWAMLEIDRGRTDNALELTRPLMELGQRVRPGAEAPSGRALHALVRLLKGQAEAEEDLEKALEELRTVDAKYQQSFLLSRWADFLLVGGNKKKAFERGQQALKVCEAIGRNSEIALCHVVLAEATDDESEQAKHLSVLQELQGRDLSFRAHNRVSEALTPDQP